MEHKNEHEAQFLMEKFFPDFNHIKRSSLVRDEVKSQASVQNSSLATPFTFY